MGQQQSTSFDKHQILGALKSRILDPDDSIFDDLLEGAENPQELLSQLSFTEISSIITVQPTNIAVLLYRLCSSLYALSTAVTPNNREIIAHLRVLYWILPPTLSTSDSDLIDSIIFHNGPVDTEKLIKGPRKIVHPPPGAPTTPPSRRRILRVPGPEENASMSLAESLTSILTSLLFLPGFTITKAAANSKEIIWASGIGCEKAKPATKDLLTNRTEVLRAILSCLSATLFQEGKDAPVDGNIKWLSLFVQSDKNKFAWEIFCSLVNIGLTYDPVGWGLPYNYLLSNDDSGETLAEVCLHALLVLLNRHQTLESNENLFQVFLQNLGKEDPNDFKFIYSHIATLLEYPLRAKNTYLPGSGKAIQSNQEVLLFFWTLISGNKGFMAHILNKEDITLVVGPIIHYILTNRKNDSANGFVHLSAFSLLMLSGERKFGVQMNKTFDRKFADHCIPSFTGSYSDFYILVMHKLLLDSSSRLASLYDTSLTILVNISPFVTSLSMIAAMKLANLFELFAKPKNLLSNPNCHRFVQFLLETFNNLIQYQYAGNAAIVYSVVQNHQSFKNLTNLKIRSKKQPEQNSPPSESVPKRWIPTNEWLQEWKSQLPLSTTIRLINAVLPDVLQLTEENKSNPESVILEYLKTPLVGLLPVPHPILTRRYQENPGTNLWFQRYMWAVIVTHNRTIPFFGAHTLDKIQLFKKSPTNPSG